MLRIMAFVLSFIGVSTQLQADQNDPPRPFASAIHAMHNGRWVQAKNLAARAGPQAIDIIEWYRLRSGRGTSSEVMRFLTLHKDWPGLKLLRRKSESAFKNASKSEVIAFFQNQPAQTGTGALIYANALRLSDKTSKANATLIVAWQTLKLTENEHSRFVSRHGKLLKPHHIARMEMALWRGAISNAKRMLALLPDDWTNLIEVRQALKSGKRGVGAMIGVLPEALQENPIIAYQRFLWRIRKGKTDGAIELILKHSQKDLLGNPESWAGWRRSLARGEMRAGNNNTAYKLASSHGLSKGSNYADLEWLAGYLALRKLNKPTVALEHFNNFESAVFTPISLGRAGYWLALTHEALAEPQAAEHAFQQAAQYQTSFYGLLAAEHAGLPIDPDLAGDESFPNWKLAQFTKSDVFKAGLIALNAGQRSLGKRFFLQVAEGLDRTELGRLGQMAIDLNAPHIAVMIGKQAAKRGIVLPEPYYALHPMHKMDLPVPKEFSLAIARRESQFDPTVVSGAGAQGLMQLMPATAKAVAQELNLNHDPADVLGNWKYNATLGSTYLAKLAKRFDGNVIMVSAGYNAGPGRPSKWMKSRGDPREDSVDIIDWIEHIPFRETRNYVMRVAESLPVYRARLGQNPLPIPFSQELVSSSFP